MEGIKEAASHLKSKNAVLSTEHLQNIFSPFPAVRKF
jgi:hypothetical protein